MSKIPTRAELMAAIADPDMSNPLAAEIALAITAYADELNRQMERGGAMPNPLVLPAPATEIEAFALELFANEFTAASGTRVKIKGDS
jgi:hypothetical protein